MDFKPFFTKLKQENAEQTAANEQKRKDKLQREFKDICDQIRAGGGGMVRLGPNTSSEAREALAKAGCTLKTFYTESILTNNTIVEGYEVRLPK
jgi:ABC-type transporter MlaC component